MKQWIPLLTGAAVVLAGVGCAPASAADGPPAAVVVGEIALPEISGVALLPGDRLLMVADEGQTVWLLENAAQRLVTGKVAKKDLLPVDLKGKLKGPNGKTREVDDLEEVTWDRQSSVFLVTSHSRNRKGKDITKKPERYTTVRMTLGSAGTEPEKLSVFDLQVAPDLQKSMERTPAQTGFNIEGAAWSQDGHLLLGLRSPTQTADREPKPNEDAILLEVTNPGANPWTAATKTTLDLNGGGIRGMLYDPEERGLWIVSGLSADPPDGMVEARWALWFRQDDGTLKPVALPREAEALANAEAVTRISIGEARQPHLLLVEDGPTVSRYVLFPVPGRQAPEPKDLKEAGAGQPPS